MRQRTFFDDDDQGSVIPTPSPFSPALARVLAEIAEEEELARLDPEARQRHFAELAAEERRRAVESRRTHQP